jgi:hypothetical protein
MKKQLKNNKKSSKNIVKNNKKPIVKKAPKLLKPLSLKKESNLKGATRPLPPVRLDCLDNVCLTLSRYTRRYMKTNDIPGDKYRNLVYGLSTLVHAHRTKADLYIIKDLENDVLRIKTSLQIEEAKNEG